MSVRRGQADATPDCVVFDLGGVLIDWDPRHLYRQLLADDDAVEAFLEEIDFMAWNHAMDAGERTWADAIVEHSARFPHHARLIAAYRERFLDTLAGPIPGTVEIVRELRERGVRLLALTNWAADTFELAQGELPFLSYFEGVLVSGREGVAKPDPAVFALLAERYDLRTPATVVVDDRAVNVEAAAAAGFVGVQFHEPERLRRDLVALGLLD